jgi:hypothetical protein
VFVSASIAIVSQGNASVSTNSGSINIVNGGVVTIAGTLTLNNGDLASELDSASTLNANGGLVVGGVPVNSSFNSDLYVFAHSTVNTGTSTVIIGDAGRGQIVLFTGSILDASGSSVVVGNQKNSQGRLEVQDHDTVFKAATLTVGVDGSASVSVSGTASISGQTIIGSTGSLSVGGTGNATIGSDLTVTPSGVGGGAVNASGGTLTWNGKFDVGENGRLSISSGALVSGSGDLSIGELGNDDKVGAFAGVDGKNSSGAASKLEAGSLMLGGATPTTTNDQGKTNGTDGDWSYTGPVGFLTISNGASTIVNHKLTLSDIIQVSSDGTETAFGDIKVISDGSLEVGGSAGADSNTLQVDSGGSLIGSGLIDSDDTGSTTADGVRIYSLEVKNLGAIEAKDGILTIHGSLSGNGEVQIDQNCTFHLAGACDAASNIDFGVDHSGTPNGRGYETVLKLDDPAEFLGNIVGFQQGDVIDLTMVDCSSAPIAMTYIGGVLSLSTGAHINVTHADSVTDPVPTVSVKPDKSGKGADLETTSIKTLFDIAFATYDADPADKNLAPPSIDSYSRIGDSTGDTIGETDDAGFRAVAYAYYDPSVNASDPNIVIAFRGTDNANAFFKNWVANGSFLAGSPNPIFQRYISDAAKFTADIVAYAKSAYPNADALITIDGHSLGGGIAELIGAASKFATATFNAPGSGQLLAKMSDELSPVMNLGFGGTEINYRAAGDPVSLVGQKIGQTYTIDNPVSHSNPSLGQILSATFHGQPGFGGGSTLTDANSYHYENFANATETILALGVTGAKIAGLGLAVHILGKVLGGVATLIDPNSGTSFVISADDGFPNFASITLPSEASVASYQVRYETGLAWSAFQELPPGVTQLLPSGVKAVEFDPYDASGQPVVLPAGFGFAASFASSGVFSGTLNITGSEPVALPNTVAATLTVQDNAAPVAIGIPMPTDAAFPNPNDLAVTVTQLPSNGSLVLVGGSTAVTLNELLTTTQLASLMFQPTAGLAASSSVFSYVVGDPDFATATGSVTVSIAGTGPGATFASLTAASDTGGTLVGAGHVVTITLTTSAPVIVSGAPVLQLNDTEVAHYTGGSGTSTLTFNYTVQPGDNVSDLQVTGLALPSGATIHDSSDNPLAAALTGDFGILVDTTAPTVSISSPGGSINHAQVTISGTVDGADAGSQVTLFDGSTLIAITDLATDGTWSAPVTFASIGAHVVTAQDADAAGNVGVSNPVTYTSLTAAPTVTSITAATDNGTNHVDTGHVINITLGTTAPMTVIGAPILQLNENEVATYAGGSGTSALAFSYMVQPGDYVADLQVTGLELPNGSSIQDATGNDLSDQVTQDLGLHVGAPPPTVSSLSAVTDSNTASVNAGHLITITMTTSEVVTVTGTPALQLNDGEVATYAGGSGSSALAFTYTVQPGDNTADLQVTGLNLLTGASIEDSTGRNLAGAVSGDLGLHVAGTPPVVAHNDAYIAAEDHPLGLTGSDSVLLNDDNATTATLDTGPSHGTLQLNTDGSFSYTPTIGFAGIDSFSYHASNGVGSADAQALLYVIPTQGTTTPTLNLLALTAEEQVAATYTAFFSRGADAAGFDFWVGLFNQYLPSLGPQPLFANIASSFGVSNEAKALYPFLANPNGASDAQISSFLDTVYNNLFNRSSDPAGLAYWTGQIKQTLASGGFVGDVLVNIISGTQVGPDEAAMMGKVAVSLEYVHQQVQHQVQYNGTTDQAPATALLHAVTNDPASVLVGIKQADQLIAAHA